MEETKSVLDEVAEMQEQEKIGQKQVGVEQEPAMKDDSPINVDIEAEMHPIDLFSSVALAVDPFNDILVIKRNGKLVVRDLSNLASPFVRFVKRIFHFFVSKKNPTTETEVTE